MFRGFVTALVACSAALTPAAAQPAEGRERARLSIGDPAPRLPQVTWILGEPVREWEKGHIYVLDFWATWCGPCIASMPHIKKLQEKHLQNNVHVLGLAIWSRPGQVPTRQWVEARNADENSARHINYRIAEEVGSSVADAFMTPTGSGGIPTVMVIDREGRLAWIGHPMSGLDETLDQMVAGTFDIAKAASEAKQRAAREEKIAELSNEFGTAQMRGDWKKLVEVADKMMEADPENMWQAGLYKYFVTLTKLEDKARAAAVAGELIDGPFRKNAMALTTLADLIASHDEIKDEDRDLALALSAVTRADEIEGSKEPIVLHTLAKVRFARKEIAEAVTAQEKAVSLADDDDMKDYLSRTLDEYRQAAQKKE